MVNPGAVRSPSSGQFPSDLLNALNPPLVPGEKPKSLTRSCAGKKIGRSHVLARFLHTLESRDPAFPCWGGRPPTASMCQNEVIAISKEGDRGEAYPNWYGHVEASLSAAWCQRGGGA